MTTRLYILEDAGYANLFPLTFSRPAFELRVGMHTLRTRIETAVGRHTDGFFVRDLLAPSLAQRSQAASINHAPAEPVTLVNGRLIASSTVGERIRTLPRNTILTNRQGELVAVHVSGESLIPTPNLLTNLAKVQLAEETIEAELIKYPWDLITHNAAALTEDAEASGTLGTVAGHVSARANIVTPERVSVAADTIVSAGVTLDASAGPIVIDAGAEIMANAALEGPIYVGKNSKIKMGAKIYGGTSIGDVCKVGGEVEGTIIHGYSNKQHEGFLGHAYIGEWCNLGADTNNSDLKNNYSPVDVIINGKKVDTGLLFVGLIMGDHSKTGINTMFNTGTVVGFSCNVFGAGYLPKSIPSFTWLDAGQAPVEYRLDKAVEVATRVMERRKQTFSEVDRALFTAIFEQTSAERQQT